MVKFKATLCFLVFAILNAQADASIKSVAEYLRLTGIGSFIDQNLQDWKIKSLNNLNLKLTNSLLDVATLSPKRQEIRNQGFLKIKMKVDDFYQWNNLKHIAIPIYQNNFTQKEIEDLIAFAKTPTGIKYWKKIHAIEGEYQYTVDISGNNFENSINAELDNLINEIKK